jgi:cell migration-inducing and hyaluronan-binding protein
MQTSRALCAAISVVTFLSLSGCTAVSEPDPGDGGTPPPAVNANWSDPATWGGTVPAAGADVVIPADKNVLLDMDTPALGSLTINGSLTFSPAMDLALTSRWIVVQGTLQVGTESSKRSRRATMTLTGDGGGDIQGFGDKMIGVLAGGRLELHGESRLAWSKLASTASVGATEISLLQAPNWRAGDRIVLASTDFDPFQAEEAVITAVSGTTVRFDTPLRYAHWGVMQSVGGVPLDERGEVGLLTRVVTIQGDSASLTTGIGGHVMVMQGATAHVEGVTFTRMGQKARLARYPMHWHMAGAVDGQYFRNNSVWKSFNRCLTVHGTDNVVADGNVCHDHIGHGFFLEDGAESGNTFTGNLVLTTRAPATGEQVLPSDTRPASYWITNPDNTYRGNVAAGSRGIGFWCAFPASPTGLSVGAADLPRRTALREFKDNVAHSNRSVGLNVDDGPTMDGTTETTNYSPRQDPAADSPGVIADFSGLHGYKNQGRGIWLRGSNLRIANAVMADNGIGATFAANETFVQNSSFIGESDNVGAGMPFYRGYEFYDGRVGADNVRFINFTKVGTIPSSALGQNRNNAFPISTGNFARQLQFINANEVYFEDPHADKDGDKAAAFYDSTGSVTGTAGTYVVANVPFMVDNTCTQRTAWNSWVCTGRRVNLRINNNGPEAAGPFTLQRDDGQSITLVGVPNTQTTGTTTALPGRSYVVTWGGAVPPRPRIFLNRTVLGEWARVTVPYPTGNIRVIRDYNSGSPLAQSASVADVDNATGAAWYFEAATGLVHLKLMTNTNRDYAAMFIEPL